MSGDSHWNSVIALLHFDGSNGSTTLTNEVSGGATPTITGSGALSTAQAKFGTASWKGDSATYFELAVGSSGSFTGDFTLEWFGHSLADGACTFYSTTGSSYLYGGSFQDYGGSALSISVTQSGWKHFVICRQGSTMRAYVDGVQTGTSTYSGTVDLRTTQWGRYVPNNNLYSTGYVDELRLTAGVCRYPGGTTFTPPTAAFDAFLPPTEARISGAPLLARGRSLAASTHARISGGPLLARGRMQAQITSVFAAAGPLLARGRALAASTHTRVSGGALLARGRSLAASTHLRNAGRAVLARGRAQAYVPPAIRISGRSLLARGRASAWHDFTGKLDGSAPTQYVMDLVDAGGTRTRVPIASWQATLQTDDLNYVQCVVPAATDWLDAIATAAEFIISRRTQVAGMWLEYEMARAPVEQQPRASGPTRTSVTLSGYTDGFAGADDPPAYLDRTLTGVRQYFVEDRTRLRADIDWLLRPGHRARWGSVEIIVGWINYYVPGPLTAAYMDVGEAAGA